jgi:hypothetical protein
MSCCRGKFSTPGDGPARMRFITLFTLSLVFHVIPGTLILNHFVQMLYPIIHVAVMKDKYQVFIKL